MGSADPRDEVGAPLGVEARKRFSTRDRVESARRGGVPGSLLASGGVTQSPDSVCQWSWALVELDADPEISSHHGLADRGTCPYGRHIRGHGFAPLLRPCHSAPDFERMPVAGQPHLETKLGAFRWRHGVGGKPNSISTYVNHLEPALA